MENDSFGGSAPQSRPVAPTTRPRRLIARAGIPMRNARGIALRIWIPDQVRDDEDEDMASSFGDEPSVLLPSRCILRAEIVGEALQPPFRDCGA